MLTELLLRFLGSTKMYDTFLQRRRQFEWMAMMSWNLSMPGDGDVIVRALRVVFLYAKRYGKMPDNLDAVKNFYVTNPDHIKYFSQDELVLHELDAVKEWDRSQYKDIDLEVLIDQCYLFLRGAFHKLSGDDYIKIAMGMKHIKRNGEEFTGPEEAKDWLRSRWQHDFVLDPPKVQGWLDENMNAVGEVMSRLIGGPEEAGRFPCGLWHIDNEVCIGSSADARFLGILGAASDGKTTTLLSMIYEWMMNGARILLVSTESEPDKIMTKFVFLHQSATVKDENGNYHRIYNFKLPTWKEWRKGQHSDEDVANFNKIRTDIETRCNIPGRLEIIQMFDWDAIKAYLKTNQAKNKYNILALDYLTNLQLPASVRTTDRDKAYDEIISDAHRLTQTFDNNRGLVVITPIAINREASKQAIKEGSDDDRENYGVYNINAIRQNTAFQYNLDMCISVFSTVEMRLERKIEIGCVKNREGDKFCKQIMLVDERSGKVVYSLDNSDPVTNRNTKKVIEPESEITDIIDQLG